MAEMEVRETSPGEFLWLWSALSTSAQRRTELDADWPTLAASGRTSCIAGRAASRGTLAMEGVGKTYSAALVKITWLDGQSHVYTLTRAQPSVEVRLGRRPPRSGEVARAYTVSRRAAHPERHRPPGVRRQFAVSGGFRRRLIGTITHSRWRTA